MPIQRCTIRGKKGFKFGSGVCYTGPDGHDRARQQGIAVMTRKAEVEGATTKAEIEAYIAAHASELADG